MSFNEITPEHSRCAFEASCPAVFEDGPEHLVIVGDKCQVADGRVGDGEAAIRVRRELLATLPHGAPPSYELSLSQQGTEFSKGVYERKSDALKAAIDLAEHFEAIEIVLTEVTRKVLISPTIQNPVETLKSWLAEAPEDC